MYKETTILYKQLNIFYRLLSLRDQECPYNKGYEFNKQDVNWYIKEDRNNKKYNSYKTYNYHPDKIYFKTEKDAQRIYNILNNKQFKL